MPPTITADTGIDALTHALEAAVSIFASPFTDAFCMQAVNLILDALPAGVPRRLGPRGAHGDGQRGDDRRAGVLERVRRRSTTRSRTPSARASGSPTAARTRSSSPTCCATTRRCRASSCPRRATRPTSRRRSTRRSPGSSGFGGKSEEDRRERLFARVDELLEEVDEPRSLAEAGVAAAEFEAALPDLARAAFSDPSIRTNPRIPLLREIVELLQAGYGA